MESQQEQEQEKQELNDEPQNEEQNNNDNSNNNEINENDNKEEQSNNPIQNEDNKSEKQNIEPVIQETPDEITILKDKINELTLQNSQLEDKIAEIKLTIPKIRSKFELEINRKDIKYNALQTSVEQKVNELNTKIKEYEQMIEKLKFNITKYRKEKMDQDNVILKQEEKITELTEQINRHEKHLRKKNEQMKQNELYSIQLVKIVNELWKKFSALENQSSPKLETQERIDFNRKLYNLNTQLNAHINKVEFLEQKNKILQNNFIKLNYSTLKADLPLLEGKKYKLGKKVAHLSRDYSHKFPKRKMLTVNNSEKSYKDELLKDFDNMVYMKQFLRGDKESDISKITYNYGTSDEYLISEAALPRANTLMLFHEDGIMNSKNYYKNETNVDDDNDDVKEINQIMESILEE